MSKLIAIFVGMCMLLGIFTVSMSHMISGNAGLEASVQDSNIVFSDDFSSGTLSKWQETAWNPTGLLEVTSSVSHSSPYCMHAQSNPGTNTGPYIIKTLDEAYSRISAEVWIYLPVKTQEFDAMYLAKVSNGTDYHIFACLDNDNYNIDLIESFYNETGGIEYHELGIDIFSLSPLVWHKLEIKIDGPNYILSVDDSEILNGLRYKDSMVDTFLLGDSKGSSGGWGDVYYDDVSITEFFEPEQIDLSVYASDISVSSTELGHTSTITTIIHGDSGNRFEDWVKSGVVLDIGGTLENGDVYSPTVIKNDNGTYTMWYVGRPDQYSSYESRIFRAFSTDGINWVKQGLVMGFGNLYEEYGVNYPYVLKLDNGTLRMWYTGISYNGGYRYHIHSAISFDDGFTWIKLGREMTYGSSGDPDGSCAPFVLYDGSLWHMWYTGVDWVPLENRICHAHKTNLEDSWIKDGVIINNDGRYDRLHALLPSVIMESGNFKMFYVGIDSGSNWRILDAVSEDGFTFDRRGIILEPDPEIRIAHPFAMDDNTIPRIWYTGSDATNTNRIYHADRQSITSAPDAICNVSVYIDSEIPGNLIHQESDVFVPGNGIVTINSTWMPDTSGFHDIIVRITDTYPGDLDLTNNVANLTVYIGNYDLNATATASGPQGSNHDSKINITYDWTGSPSAVNIYYSTNSGMTWNYLYTDETVDGYYLWGPEAHPEPKPSKYYWIASAIGGADDLGLPADDSVPEAGPFNWKTLDLSFSSAESRAPGTGWTFISIPLEINGDISALNDSKWGDGGTTWDMIRWYDKSDPVDPWKCYNINKPESLNDELAITQQIGIWVHLTANNGDHALTVGETGGPTTTNIQLTTGWNLVGYPSLTSMKVQDALWGTGATAVERFNSASPYLIEEAGPTDYMEPGQAYWVYVPADSIWTVDW